jgi:hypothetical protein
MACPPHPHSEHFPLRFKLHGRQIANRRACSSALAKAKAAGGMAGVRPETSGMICLITGMA